MTDTPAFLLELDDRHCAWLAGYDTGLAHGRAAERAEIDRALAAKRAADLAVRICELDAVDPEVEYPGPVDPFAPTDDAAPAEPLEPVSPVSPETPTETGAVLDDVRSWLSRFIRTMSGDDLDLLTLWAAHTHLCLETYTTPRLMLDSPVPGSGKTTTLEHLERLCVRPVQMASLSSPALLARMLDKGIRTILIDEADRSLDPKREGVAELLAVLNSGYKRGGTRPVLVPTKDGWNVSEMPTFAPVAMAGNNPQLPEDTRQRSIRVLLLPDLDGGVEDSDWETLDGSARTLGARLGRWADLVRDDIRATRPPLPDGIKGRGRERWLPLKRVAVAAGGRWPERVDALALHDKEQEEMDREDGMIRTRPAVVLLAHLHELWPEGEPFVATADLIRDLALEHPDEWGDGSPFGKPVTAQRLGRMLATAYKVNTTRVDRNGPRGYAYAALLPAWRQMGVVDPDPAPAPVPSTPSGETGAIGATGETGARECRACGESLHHLDVAEGAQRHAGCVSAAVCGSDTSDSSDTPRWEAVS